METKNGVKNGENTQFSSTNQPSGEAKKAGWARRQKAQEMMDRITGYFDLTIEGLSRLEAKMKKEKGNYTIGELLALTYVSKTIKKDKFLLHWMDLHISKSDERSTDNDLDHIFEELDNEFDPDDLERAQIKLLESTSK